MLALIQALQYYIAATTGSITIFTYHNPTTFLHKVKNKNQMLMRWNSLPLAVLRYSAHKGPRQHYCRCLVKN